MFQYSFKRWQDIFYTAGKRFYRERYTYRASALSFTTLLALVPLITVILSLMAMFPIFNEIIQLAQHYILTNFIPTSGNTIQYYLEIFIKQANHLPILGIIFLFFTAMLLILTVEHTLNDIWKVGRKKKNKFALLIYWGVLIIAPLFIGLSVLLSTYLFSLSWFSDTTTQLGLKLPLLACLPLVINTIIFSLLYIIVPNHPVNFSHGFTGGFIAAFFFELAKKGFAFYIEQFPSYALIYGALSVIPIFLLWIYISWLIVLFGALVTRAME